MGLRPRGLGRLGFSFRALGRLGFWGLGSRGFRVWGSEFRALELKAVVGFRASRVFPDLLACFIAFMV